MVFALEQRWVDTDTENPPPYSQMNAEVLIQQEAQSIHYLFYSRKQRAETFNMAQNNHPQDINEKSQQMK